MVKLVTNKPRNCIAWSFGFLRQISSAEKTGKSAHGLLCAVMARLFGTG